MAMRGGAVGSQFNISMVGSPFDIDVCVGGMPRWERTRYKVVVMRIRAHESNSVRLRRGISLSESSVCGILSNMIDAHEQLWSIAVGRSEQTQKSRGEM